MDATHQEAPDDYKPGNKRPPKHTQFKPGQSGNPSGLRKNHTGGSVLPRRNLKSAVLAGLDEQRVVIVNGKRRQASFQELIVERLLAMAANGDSKALGQLLPLIHAFEGDLLAQLPRPPNSIEAEQKHMRQMQNLYRAMQMHAIAMFKKHDTEEKRKQFLLEADKECKSLLNKIDVSANDDGKTLNLILHME
jgi:hypothetical protein